MINRIKNWFLEKRSRMIIGGASLVLVAFFIAVSLDSRLFSELFGFDFFSFFIIVCALAGIYFTVYWVLDRMDGKS